VAIEPDAHVTAPRKSWRNSRKSRLPGIGDR
jgi:hypothetical protein